MGNNYKLRKDQTWTEIERHSTFGRGSAMEKPISQHLASDKPQPSTCGWPRLKQTHLILRPGRAQEQSLKTHSTWKREWEECWKEKITEVVFKIPHVNF